MKPETIEIKVDAFIVPNRMNSCMDYTEFSQNRVVEHILRFNKLNGTECNAVTDPLIQLWYTGEESCKSTDLQSHGFSVDSTRMHMHPWSEFVPLSFLKNKVEGDVVPIKVLAYINGEDETERECVVTLNCRLSQRKYRYRREGNFEDCLAMLTRDYNKRHANAAVTA